MKIIVSSPAIAPHIKQTVMAYQEKGFLKQFFTSFADFPGNKFSFFLSKIGKIHKMINRRSFTELPHDKFSTRPLPELLRSLSARKFNRLVTDRIWEWSEIGFDKWVARQLAPDFSDAVHTYEHAALATLERAKELNLFSVYEQPSQHHLFFTILAKQQIACYPELQNASTELLINKKAERRNRRRDAELAVASLILCNSSFTKRTLVEGGVDPSKITVIPLAFPPVTYGREKSRPGKPVIFLYAGNQSIRKASHLLYLAWRKCNFMEEHANLWLIGKMNLPEHLRTGLPGSVMIMENIPHGELMELYRKADVFVMPTLADGFGMVITEAMSQGVPVIASENCCAPDIIEHMKDGWIIPAGDIDALATQMNWCVANRHELVSFSDAAKNKALSWQWPQYREKLARIIFERCETFQQEKRSV